MLKVPSVVSTEATSRWVEFVPISIAATLRIDREEVLLASLSGSGTDTASNIVGSVPKSFHSATHD